MEKWSLDDRDSLALYLHVPFCRHRCTYCDFNTHVGLDDWQTRYVDALCHEIVSQGTRFASAGRRNAAHSLFLGGGTPTRLPADQIGRIAEACAGAFALEEHAEITVEANPTSVEAPYLESLREIGVNRLSLGVQSFADEELALLGRLHDAATARQAFAAAREAGFDNISLDLIYGLPGQGLHTWRETLAAALALEPEHLSLYSLGLEPGTPLHDDVVSGRLLWPDPDVAADQYELAEKMLAQSGYAHYEISNWARQGMRHASRHNLTYWRNEPYLGLGAGAHSWIASARFANRSHPVDYVRCLERVASAPSDLGFPLSCAARSASVEQIPMAMEMAETMILGLRLVVEGVGDERFNARFGRSLRDVYAAQLLELVGLGLLEDGTDRVRLTARGRLLGNEVFQRFLPD